jgi:PleD family two-component response regulator
VDFQTNDSGENLWILVADASKENFRRICVAMERKNVSLHHAQTLDAAFVKAKAIQFAAILVNLDLPDDVPREIARQLPVLRCSRSELYAREVSSAQAFLSYQQEGY